MQATAAQSGSGTDEPEETRDERDWRRSLRIGDRVLISATIVRRPGMVHTPEVDVCEPSLAEGYWVELGMPSLTYSVFVPLTEIERALLKLDP